MGICERLRNPTPMEWRWIKLIAFVLLIILISSLIYAYRDNVFDALRSMAEWMRHAGFGGVVLMGGWAFLTSFPPFPLRETGMKITGYIWGVGYGFLIAFTGSFIGSVLCFLLGRYLFRDRVSQWIQGDKHLTAIRQSLSNGGLKLLLLLRLGPFPFSWMSLFLSATDVKLTTYVWATLAGLQWVWYQVWLGTVLNSVEAAANLDFSAETTKVNLGVAFGSAILSLIVLWYLKRLVEEILKHDATREAEGRNQEGLVPLSDVAPTIPMNELGSTDEMPMPVGFSRRFTPPSHALWTAPTPSVNPVTEDKKDDQARKGSAGNGSSGSSSTGGSSLSRKSTGVAATQDEVVSMQDSTGGLISGPLVDLEMMAKAVASVRKASQEDADRKKTVEERKKADERKSSEHDGSVGGDLSEPPSRKASKKASEDRGRGKTAPGPSNV